MSNCPIVDPMAIEQSDLWQHLRSGHLEPHEMGWIIAGATAAASAVISFATATLHAIHYHKPAEQRMIMRIVLIPAVYALVSFFSYRYFRAYTYYALTLTVYEALALAAFLYLLLLYVGASSEAQRRVLQEKDKRRLIVPFCCFHYRPSKPYFLHALKWSVLQYSLLRPLITIVGIICQTQGLLCPTKFSPHFAAVYLDAIDFVSISVALFGLIVFYTLVRDQLRGHRPLAKFLCIKIVVALLFYQGFIFDALEAHGTIKATTYWTAVNVADGLNSLCVCCEMVLISLFMMWAYNWSEYKAARKPGAALTNPFKAYWDCFNYADFILEGFRGIQILFDYIRGVPGTHTSYFKQGFNIEQAFLSPQSHSSPHSDSFTPLNEKGTPSKQHPELREPYSTTAIAGSMGRPAEMQEHIPASYHAPQNEQQSPRSPPLPQGASQRPLFLEQNVSSQRPISVQQPVFRTAAYESQTPHSSVPYSRPPRSGHLQPFDVPPQLACAPQPGYETPSQQHLSPAALYQHEQQRWPSKEESYDFYHQRDLTGSASARNSGHAAGYAV